MQTGSNRTSVRDIPRTQLFLTLVLFPTNSRCAFADATTLSNPVAGYAYEELQLYAVAIDSLLSNTSTYQTYCEGADSPYDNATGTCTGGANTTAVPRIKMDANSLMDTIIATTMPGVINPIIQLDSSGQMDVNYTVYNFHNHRWNAVGEWAIATKNLTLYGPLPGCECSGASYSTNATGGSVQAANNGDSCAVTSSKFPQGDVLYPIAWCYVDTTTCTDPNAWVSDIAPASANVSYLLGKLSVSQVLHTGQH